MSKCIYYNEEAGLATELPALPEYNETEYPYAYIIQLTTVPMYHLVLMPRDATRNEYVGDGSDSYTVSHYVMYYARAVDDTWGDPEYFDAGSIHVHKSPMFFADGFINIWSNFDIYDGSSLICHASDPIPVEEPPEEEKKSFCLRSWLTGFALGLAGKPLPFVAGKREPVAYLYNGVRLPDINTVWTDKDTHPYAMIGKDSAGKCTLYVSAVTGTFAVSSGRFLFESGTFEKPAVTITYSCCVGEEKWAYEQTYSMWGGLGMEIYESEPAFWSSHDTYHYNSGELYIGASEPTPVYE